MKRIELLFENEEGKTVKYTLDQPTEPVNKETVKSVMDTIIAQNVFDSTGGELVAKKSARLVENVIEEISLED